MGTDIQPYVQRNPGDLITSGDWNDVQVDVKKDIASQIQTAVGQINNVQHAGDADTLGGQTPGQLTQAIIDKILAAIPGRTGYQMIFKRLRTCEEKLIKHSLHNFPLVDVYQLDYFEAVCAKGETIQEESDRFVNMYLYHTSEKRIRIPGSPPTVVDIEPPDSTPYKIPFADMLDRYKIQYTDTTSLDDLETDFWTAFFSSPNDQFDPDQYCHSPWFEKCCGEKRSVKELKGRGDWDDIWLKMQPRKTINYPWQDSDTDPCLRQGPILRIPIGREPAPQAPQAPTDAPSKIQVVHFDFDTVGVKLIGAPDYPAALKASGAPVPPDFDKEAKLMVLLKV